MNGYYLEYTGDKAYIKSNEENLNQFKYDQKFNNNTNEVINKNINKILYEPDVNYYSMVSNGKLKIRHNFRNTNNIHYKNLFIDFLKIIPLENLDSQLSSPIILKIEDYDNGGVDWNFGYKNWVQNSDDSNGYGEIYSHSATNYFPFPNRIYLNSKISNINFSIKDTVFRQRYLIIFKTICNISAESFY